MKIKIVLILMVVFLAFEHHAIGLQLLAPNGGEHLVAGGTYTIVWESSPGDPPNCTLEWSSDNGLNWQFIFVPDCSHSSYEWDPVPLVESNECLIRIWLGWVCPLDIACLWRCAGHVDMDDDGDVDLYDFAVLAAAWQSSPGDENWNRCCDVSEPADGVIDLMDLAALVDQWLVDYAPSDVSDEPFTISQY